MITLDNLKYAINMVDKDRGYKNVISLELFLNFINSSIEKANELNVNLSNIIFDYEEIKYIGDCIINSPYISTIEFFDNKLNDYINKYSLSGDLIYFIGEM